MSTVSKIPLDFSTAVTLDFLSGERFIKSENRVSERSYLYFHFEVRELRASFRIKTCKLHFFVNVILVLFRFMLKFQTAIFYGEIEVLFCAGFYMDRSV